MMNFHCLIFVNKNRTLLKVQNAHNWQVCSSKLVTWSVEDEVEKTNKYDEHFRWNLLRFEIFLVFIFLSLLCLILVWIVNLGATDFMQNSTRKISEKNWKSTRNNFHLNIFLVIIANYVREKMSRQIEKLNNKHWI